MQRIFGMTNVFAFFTGFTGLAMLIAPLFVRETKRRTPKNIATVFGVSMLRFVQFQLRVMVPWIIRRYIVRRRYNGVWPKLKELYVGGEEQTQREMESRYAMTDRREDILPPRDPDFTPDSVWRR